jgi:hypothetical protein
MCKGKFFLLTCNSPLKQCYLFKYNEVVGCRNATGEMLPPVETRLLNVSTLYGMDESKVVRVGSQFLYGVEDPYEMGHVKDSMLHISDANMKPGDVVEYCESKKTHNMAKAIERFIGVGYHVDVICGRGDSSDCTPFSGGGDIYITKDNTRGVVITSSDGYDTETVVAIENKCKTAQSEGQVQLQLQCEMMLLAGQILHTRLQQGLVTDKILCYGVCFGPTLPISLLKLIVNFDTGDSKYQLLFKVRPHAAHHVHIDLILSYALQKLMN